MKKVFKTLFIVLLVEGVLAIVLLGLGFRITYNPDIITDWEAVSAVAGWVSAIATICIPIIVVVFQHKLDENKNAISEANKATLGELQKFAEAYAPILQQLTDVMDGTEEIVFDCGGAFPRLTKKNVVDYITASIQVTLADVVTYFNVSSEDAEVILNELLNENKIKKQSNSKEKTYSLV